MKINLSRLIATAGATLKRYPVEMGIAAYGFVAGALLYEEVFTDHQANIALAPLFFALAFVLNNAIRCPRGRWAYYLCWVSIAPLWAVDPEAWVVSAAYAVTLANCVLGVAASRWTRDNKAFASEALTYLFNAVVAAFFAGIAHLLLIAIYFSTVYIFGLPGTHNSDFLFYSSMAAYALALPMMLLTFTRGNIDRELRPARMLDTLLNYIFTPALLAYTAILYAYFVQIAVTWSLPKGGLAYMIFVFAMLAVVVRSCQPLLGRRLYDWFFGRFSLIALPAVAMFWIGTLYRIRQYGFTEWRVYLLLCGVIMTLTLLMLVSRRAGRYLYIALMAGLVLSLFTYIPGLSAADIAVRSQERRVEALASGLGLLGPDGQFAGDTIIRPDSVQAAGLRELYESLLYLYDHGATLRGLNIPSDLSDYVAEGLWGEIIYGNKTSVGTSIYLDADGARFDLSGYPVFAPSSCYAKQGSHYDDSNDTLRIYQDERQLLAIPFDSLMAVQFGRAGLSTGALPDEETLNACRSELMLFRADSLAVLFSSIWLGEEAGRPVLSNLQVNGVATRADRH